VLKPIGLLLEGAATNLIIDPEFNEGFSSNSMLSLTIEKGLPDIFGTNTAIRFYGQVERGQRIDFTGFGALTGTFTQSFWVTTESSTTSSVVLKGRNLSNNIFSGEFSRYKNTEILSNKPGYIGIFCNVSGYLDITVELPQFEKGSYPTSYVPTQGTQVTRASDVSTSPQVTRAADNCVRVLGDEFNQTEWSISGESTQNSPVGSAIFLSGDAGLNGKSFRLGFPSNAGQCLWFKPNDTASNVSIPLSDFGSIDLGEPVKWAASYGNGAVGVAVNGVYRSRLVAGSPENLINMRVGQISGANNNISGSTRNLLIYPKALSEAELIAITGVN